VAAGADPSWLLHGFSRCGYRAEGAGPPVFCGRSALRYVAATFSACRHRGLETSATSRTLNPMHDSSLPSLRAWVPPGNRASACQLSAPGFAGACQIDRRASSRCHGSAVRGGKSARVDQRRSAPARALRARAQLTDHDGFPAVGPPRRSKSTTVRKRPSLSPVPSGSASNTSSCRSRNSYAACDT